MFVDRWIEGEDGVWRFVDPGSGKVLGEVRAAVGHRGSWTFSAAPGSIGICKDQNLAMRFVENVALRIGEAKTEEPN